MSEFSYMFQSLFYQRRRPRKVVVDEIAHGTEHTETGKELLVGVISVLCQLQRAVGETRLFCLCCQDNIRRLVMFLGTTVFNISNDFGMSSLGLHVPTTVAQLADMLRVGWY